MSSCGYQFAKISQFNKKICIPYVEGDHKGLMTSALTHAFSYKGYLTASPADLLLKVSLFAPEDVTIGFIYAPADKGDNFFPRLVVSNEARITLSALVSLQDTKTGQTLFGPLNLSAFIDYDYEPDLSNVGEHEKSLGQLEMHNLAQDAALPPLYQLLAEKIVDYVSYCW